MTSSRTRSRSSRPAATASSCRAGGSCSTTSSPTSTTTIPAHPNAPDGGKRPRSSMAPTIVTRGGRARAGARLAGRVDDHHDRPADPARAHRLRQDPAARRSPRRERSQRNSATTQRRAAVHPVSRGDRAGGARRPRIRAATRPTAEIGAATGIEFLAPRTPARRRRAGAPRRRQRDGRQAARTPLDDAVEARISARTSSRFDSMSSRERSDSRLRRSSGSVFEGRTLKCQSS